MPATSRCAPAMQRELDQLFAAHACPSACPPDSQKLTEATSLALANQIQQQSPVLDSPERTPYCHDLCKSWAGPSQSCCSMGFDSSLLEFRRLVPYPEAQAETLALDLLGFGFTDRTVYARTTVLAASNYICIVSGSSCIAQPVVLIGASMGGAAAIDFALTYPEAVAGLVLLDSAGFAAGAGFRQSDVSLPLIVWATAFLANTWVRRQISRQAYCDKSFVTADAERCAALAFTVPWLERGVDCLYQKWRIQLSKRTKSLRSPALPWWSGESRTPF
jgi:pimeloyl-ACP methyl ester carboxylesterase